MRGARQSPDGKSDNHLAQEFPMDARATHEWGPGLGPRGWTLRAQRMTRCFVLCLGLVGLLYLLACRRGQEQPLPPPATEATENAPAPPATADATVRRVESRQDVPLQGPRVDARKGDWLLQGSGGIAVVSSAKGEVVDFGAEGGEDALVGVDPTVFLGLDEVTSVVESVGPAGPGGHAVLVQRRMLSDPPLRLWTYVTFADGALRIESVATTQEQPVLAVTLGEVVAWGNVPTWVEGHGF